MTHSLKLYKNKKPFLDFRSYYTGPLKAWGVIQARNGRVIQKIDMDMIGSWQGDIGKLHEVIRYQDGSSEERTWSITYLNNDQYEGTTSNVIGKAVGSVCGNAANTKYKMKVPIGKKTIICDFDDWMFAIDEKNVMNRITMRKFGIKLAEISIFIQKL